MIRQELSTLIIKQAFEYKADARAWQERNRHMHDATPEQIAEASDQWIGMVIGQFRDYLVTSNGPTGSSRGDLAHWIVEKAKTFVATWKLEPVELSLAIITGFCNYVAGKQWIDLGLYAKDLISS